MIQENAPTSDRGRPNALRKYVRLYVSGFVPHQPIILSTDQNHYLIHVMRKKVDDPLLIFDNGQGEWLARITLITKKEVTLVACEQTRLPASGADIWYLFAPLKAARLDYLIQKATELGASTLIPVITQRTQVSRLKIERLTANAIEAAEQCGLTHVPDVYPETNLAKALDSLATNRVLIFADEDTPCVSPVEALRGIPQGMPCAVLVGPEGGFDDDERALIMRHHNTLRLSLGSRIVRADTAAVMALTLVQALIGDMASRNA
jgi:16S rRNA (uracil1498-N3)-methyltransferase